MSIPKIIHYCWFGSSEKPEIINKCISSWKKHCLDYEIKEWNESNFNVNMFRYTKEAYDAKKWAFVSDVARLWAVFNFGGIYMDTDVEMLDNIDSLLNNDLFMFFQSERSINTGLGFGAKKGSDTIKQLIKDYIERPFALSKGKYDLTPCPTINTKTLRLLFPSLQLTGKTQLFYSDSKELVSIYSCCDYNKYLYHYGAASWTDSPKTDFSKKKWKDTALKRFLRNPTRVSNLENKLPEKLFSFYIFVSYDLLEYSPLYFMKKLFNKFNKFKKGL